MPSYYDYLFNIFKQRRTTQQKKVKKKCVTVRSLRIATPIVCCDGDDDGTIREFRNNIERIT